MKIAQIQDVFKKYLEENQHNQTPDTMRAIESLSTLFNTEESALAYINTAKPRANKRKSSDPRIDHIIQYFCERLSLSKPDRTVAINRANASNLLNEFPVSKIEKMIDAVAADDYYVTRITSLSDLYSSRNKIMRTSGIVQVETNKGANDLERAKQMFGDTFS